VTQDHDLDVLGPIASRKVTADSREAPEDVEAIQVSTAGGWYRCPGESANRSLGTLQADLVVADVTRRNPERLLRDWLCPCRGDGRHPIQSAQGPADRRPGRNCTQIRPFRAWVPKAREAADRSCRAGEVPSLGFRGRMRVRDSRLIPKQQTVEGCTPSFAGPASSISRARSLVPPDCRGLPLPGLTQHACGRQQIPDP